MSNRNGGAQQRQSAGAVPRGETAKRFNDAEFVRRELEIEEKRHLRGLYVSSEWDFLEKLTEVLSRPCKVTFNWDNYSDCWACWIFSPTRIGKPQAILPGRGKTPDRAFAEAWYKLTVIFGGQFPDVMGTRPKEKSWDDDNDL